MLMDFEICFRLSSVLSRVMETYRSLLEIKSFGEESDQKHNTKRRMSTMRLSDVRASENYIVRRISTQSGSPVLT